MVVMDSTTLLLLFYPGAAPPIDPKTNKPLEKSKERIEFLLKNLSDSNQRVVIPTPALSEILIVAGDKVQELLDTINNSKNFIVVPFDQMAAVELSVIAGSGLKAGEKTKRPETYAKLKYDWQILSVAKSRELKTIYSDDDNLAKHAKRHGITVIKTHELQLPPLPPQTEIEFVSPQLPA